MTQLTPIPLFENEREEHDFWEKADSTPYINWPQGQVLKLKKLRPSTKTISIRLPESLIEDVQILAHKRDIPYQSLMKLLLEAAVSEEKAKLF